MSAGARVIRWSERWPATPGRPRRGHLQPAAHGALPGALVGGRRGVSRLARPQDPCVPGCAPDGPFPGAIRRGSERGARLPDLGLVRCVLQGRTAVMRKLFLSPSARTSRTWGHGPGLHTSQATASGDRAGSPGARALCHRQLIPGAVGSLRAQIPQRRPRPRPLCSPSGRLWTRAKLSAPGDRIAGSAAFPDW